MPKLLPSPTPEVAPRTTQIWSWSRKVDPTNTNKEHLRLQIRKIWEKQIRKIWEMRWKNNNFFPWEQHWLLVIIHSRLHCPDQASFIAIALIDQDLCWLFTYAQFIQNQFNTNEQSIPNAHSPFIVNALQCIVDWSGSLLIGQYSSFILKSFNLLYLNSGSRIKLAFFLVNSILCRLM